MLPPRAQENFFRAQDTYDIGIGRLNDEIYHGVAERGLNLGEYQRARLEQQAAQVGGRLGLGGASTGYGDMMRRRARHADALARERINWNRFLEGNQFQRDSYEANRFTSQQDTLMDAMNMEAQRVSNRYG